MTTESNNTNPLAGFDFNDPAVQSLYNESKISEQAERAQAITIKFDSILDMGQMTFALIMFILMTWIVYTVATKYIESTLGRIIVITLYTVGMLNAISL